MAKNTNEDNDLIILSDDDTSTDTLVIEDSNMNEDIIGSSDEIITFGEEGTSADQDTDVFGDLKEESDNLDLGETTEDAEEEKSDDLDLGSFMDESKEDIKEEDSNIDSVFGLDNITPETGSVGTMEDILDRTMSELESRSELIGKEKDSEEANISDLKEQIKSLETKADIANDRVSELNEEQSMIAKNIKSIEGMKKNNITTDIKSTTSTKVHNVKRKQAA